MNRRLFLKGIAASAAALAVPLVAVAPKPTLTLDDIKRVKASLDAYTGDEYWGFVSTDVYAELWSKDVVDIIKRESPFVSLSGEIGYIEGVKFYGSS